MLFPFSKRCGMVSAMDLTLEDVENILRSELSKYRNLDRWEDGIQEGLIRAWQDMSEGVDEKWKIVNRAKFWARTFILNSDGRRHPTGHPPSRTGQYSVKETQHIKTLTTPDGHVDYAAYKYTSIDTSIFAENDQETAVVLPVESFESEVVERMDFMSKLEGMEKKQQTALFLHIMYGYSVPEIGRMLGYVKHPQPNGYKILHKAFRQAKEAV